jgi:hypothetical protein
MDMTTLPGIVYVILILASLVVIIKKRIVKSKGFNIFMDDVEFGKYKYFLDSMRDNYYKINRK